MAPKMTKGLQDQVAALDLDDLVALQEDIAELIESKVQVAKDALRTKMAAEAEKLGIDPRELFAKAKKPVAVKYRDSEGNTWTGRGRRPKVWANLTDKELEKLLINK